MAGKINEKRRKNMIILLFVIISLILSTVAMATVGHASSTSGSGSSYEKCPEFEISGWWMKNYTYRNNLYNISVNATNDTVFVPLKIDCSDFIITQKTEFIPNITLNITSRSGSVFIPVTTKKYVKIFGDGVIKSTNYYVNGSAKISIDFEIKYSKIKNKTVSGKFKVETENYMRKNITLFYTFKIKDREKPEITAEVTGFSSTEPIILSVFLKDNFFLKELKISGKWIDDKKINLGNKSEYRGTLKIKPKKWGNITFNVMVTDVFGNENTKRITVYVDPSGIIKFKNVIRESLSYLEDYSFKVFDLSNSASGFSSINFNITVSEFSWTPKINLTENGTVNVSDTEPSIILRTGNTMFSASEGKTYSFTADKLFVDIYPKTEGKLDVKFTVSADPRFVYDDVFYVSVRFKNYTVYENDTIEIGGRKAYCYSKNSSYFECCTGFEITEDLKYYGAFFTKNDEESMRKIYEYRIKYLEKIIDDERGKSLIYMILIICLIIIIFIIWLVKFSNIVPKW